MDALAIGVLLVFIGTYVIISSEKVNRTGMSLLGMGLTGVVIKAAEVMGISDGITFLDLIHHIEWDTVLFVTSMMIIVSVAGGSGMFQFLALKLAAPSGGRPKSLYTIFLVFVFFISLFLDNVSTILIMAPLSIQVCQALRMDFKPLLISEAIVANVGSIPSIVGAVPNIVIAKAANIDAGMLFLTFMPISMILFIVTWLVLTYYFKDKFTPTDADNIQLLFRIDPSIMIKSRRDFYASVIAFAGLIIGFTLSASLGISPSMIAIIVAASLLILAHERAAEFLTEVGWDTIFFLVGLFGLVGALDLTGIIEAIGDGLLGLIGDNAVIALVFMVWIPAILSAFLDNLPVSAVLAPVALRFSTISAVLPLALVFAVNVGGNVFTPLGSPSNMVAIGESEKEHDPISFADFAKAGTFAGMFHLGLGSLWVVLVELVNFGLLVISGFAIALLGFIFIILPQVTGKGFRTIIKEKLNGKLAPEAKVETPS
ncbi:MAG: hypothetical protein GF411_03295 [Candidatus Lokiarchaeota archaeon]|nr:hypothetical protein [Candidatus Lokiarchaeota archaeon]